jgi:hypothetical protein
MADESGGPHHVGVHLVHHVVDDGHAAGELAQHPLILKVVRRAPFERPDIRNVHQARGEVEAHIGVRPGPPGVVCHQRDGRAVRDRLEQGEDIVGGRRLVVGGAYLHARGARALGETRQLDDAKRAGVLRAEDHRDGAGGFFQYGFQDRLAFVHFQRGELPGRAARQQRAVAPAEAGVQHAPDQPAKGRQVEAVVAVERRGQRNQVARNLLPELCAVHIRARLAEPRRSPLRGVLILGRAVRALPRMAPAGPA